MDFIRDVIEWVANETVGFGAGLFPLLMLGLVGLYILWLVVGYLRVSQVGIHEGHERREVVTLPHRAGAGSGETEGRAETEAEQLETAAGAPYCPVDALVYPAGARYCTQCERDLVLDCTKCGATLPVAATSCYRCGTPTSTAAVRAH